MPASFSLPLAKVRPSQCYLNGEKVAQAAEWFDFDDPNYEPLPVRQFDPATDHWYLTDGHTRAFLAVLAGETELAVVEDVDDLPDDLYRECIGWCREADVTHITDLVGRVVGPETFEVVWIERCQEAGARLEDAT